VFNIVIKHAMKFCSFFANQILPIQYYDVGAIDRVFFLLLLLFYHLVSFNHPYRLIKSSISMYCKQTFNSAKKAKMPQGEKRLLQLSYFVKCSLVNL